MTEKYTAQCPFDCTQWDECVCANTARSQGGAFDPADHFFTGEQLRAMQCPNGTHQLES